MRKIVFLIILTQLCLSEKKWMKELIDDIGEATQFSSVQSLSHVWFCVIPWTAAHQASLSITSSWSLLKLTFGDAIQPSHPVWSPSPPTFNLSQHPGLLKQVSSFHQVAKVLEFQLRHQSFHEHSGVISLRMDWLDLLAVQETLKSSPTPQFKSVNSLLLSFLYSPTLTSRQDYWKKP